MKFSVKDRIVLPPILPSEGSYTDMVIRRDLIEKLTLSQKEIEEFEVKVDGGQITWDEKKAKEKDVELTELELGLLRKSLKKLDDDKKLTDDFIDLYKKIIS